MEQVSIVADDGVDPIMLLPKVQVREALQFSKLLESHHRARRGSTQAEFYSLNRDRVLPDDDRVGLYLGVPPTTLSISADDCFTAAYAKKYLTDKTIEKLLYKPTVTAPSFGEGNDISKSYVLPKMIDSYGDTSLDSLVKSLRKFKRIVVAEERRLSAPIINPFEGFVHIDRNCDECMRLVNSYGGINVFLQWIYSRWRNMRSDMAALRAVATAQPQPDTNVPHFCGFVNTKPLHEDRDTDIPLPDRQPRTTRTARHGWENHKIKSTLTASKQRNDTKLSSDWAYNATDLQLQKGRHSSRDYDTSRHVKNYERIRQKPNPKPKPNVETPPATPEPIFEPTRSTSPDLLSLASSQSRAQRQKEQRRVVQSESKKTYKTNSTSRPSSKTKTPQRNSDLVKPAQDSLKLLEEAFSPVSAVEKYKSTKKRRPAANNLSSEKQTVPDLPEYQPATTQPVQQQRKQSVKTFAPYRRPRPQRVTSVALNEEVPKVATWNWADINMEPVLEQSVTQEQEKKKPTNWSNLGRLSLSQQSCRFGLPIDMRDLQDMTPKEYLRKFCVISPRRLALYHKMYLKHKDPKILGISGADLGKALTDVMVGAVNSDQVEQVSQLATLSPQDVMDQKLFSGVCALAERLLFSSQALAAAKRASNAKSRNGTRKNEETTEAIDYQKQKLETADFHALEYKFAGIEVNEDMKRLLYSL